MTRMKLKGKVAIVTGASRGIGKAIARAYAEEGASVVLASRSLGLLEEIEREICTSGGEAMALPLDVRKTDSINQLIEKTVARYGRLDILVNNAGISMACDSEGSFPRIGLPLWRRTSSGSFSVARPLRAS